MGNEKTKQGFDKLLTNGTFLMTNTTHMGLGNIKKTKGFQRVRVNRGYLQEALDLLKNYNSPDGLDGDTVLLFVKTNHVIQIGSENIGVIIAPVVGDEDKIEGKKYK